jgi:four helix bundle protein
MHTPIRQEVLDHALHVIQLVSPVAEAVARRDRELASQLRRAASSVALNIAEGFGNHAGNARLRFEAARGSLYETHAAVRVAVAWGYVSADATQEALAAIDALGGRVFGLARR